MALISTYSQKFVKFYWRKLMKCSCVSSQIWVWALCMQILGHKQHILLAKQSKPVLVAKFVLKSASTHTYIQKFGQHSFLHLTLMLLYIQASIGTNCTAANPWKSTPKPSCTIGMFPARSNRSNPGQSENDNFLRLKKNTRNFFNLKKNMAISRCHRRHTLRNRVETIGRGPRNDP